MTSAEVTDEWCRRMEKQTHHWGVEHMDKAANVIRMQCQFTQQQQWITWILLLRAKNLSEIIRALKQVPPRLPVGLTGEIAGYLVRPTKLQHGDDCKLTHQILC